VQTPRGPEKTRRASQRTSLDGARTTRRRRGEARQLLLEAGHELFARQGFTNTSTREIADRAGVAEPLLFRHFGAKVGLFREALVGPFLEFVEDFRSKWDTGTLAPLDDEEIIRQFVGDLYELFQLHRGLVLTLWASDAQSLKDFAGSGIFDDIDRGMHVLQTIGTAETVRRKRRPAYDSDLNIRVLLAMIAGVAISENVRDVTLPPSRADIIEELVQTILHGRLHRSG
jgi:AcrR family transcriptional regulator